MVRQLRYFAKFEILLFCVFAANIVPVMPTNDTTPPPKITTKMPTTPMPMTTTSVAKSCKFFGESKQNGQYWTHRGQFNVTCLRGKIKVLNCVTERGVRLELGTKEFLEDGVRYSCQLNVAMDRAQQRETLLRQNTSIAAENPVHDCDQQRQQNGAAGAGANSRGDEFVRDGFVVDCASGGILGCLDISGDLVKSDHFYVLSAWRLRRCEVYARGRWAKSERKAIFGCFNGTALDDPDDAKMHVPVGRTWQSGPFVLRCGDDGIHVYKCVVEGRHIHTGTAWIDKDNVLNVCK